MDPFGLAGNRACAGRPCRASKGRRYTDRLNIQIGSMIMTFNPDGVQWTQTTGIGIGAYASVCQADVEKPKKTCGEDVDTDPFGVDSASASFKALYGVTIKDNGNVCILVGPMLTLPGFEWDLTPKKDVK